MLGTCGRILEEPGSNEEGHRVNCLFQNHLMKNYPILLAAALGAVVACSAPAEENAEAPAELGYQVYTIR